MSEISYNLEDVYESYSEMINMRDEITTLSVTLSEINLDGLEISTYLLDESKSLCKTMDTGIDELTERIINVIKEIVTSDPEMATLFQEYANNSNISLDLLANITTTKTVEEGPHTGTLNAPKGYITNGPGGKNGNDGYETWYDLPMSTVVKNMKEKYGIDLDYWVNEETGIKMYGDYIMVAADVKNAANPDGTYEYGQIVETSLGLGMVVDYCGIADQKRTNGKEVHFDIATAWHTQPYEAKAYSDGYAANKAIADGKTSSTNSTVSTTLKYQESNSSSSKNSETTVSLNSSGDTRTATSLKSNTVKSNTNTNNVDNESSVVETSENNTISSISVISDESNQQSNTKTISDSDVNTENKSNNYNVSNLESSSSYTSYEKDVSVVNTVSINSNTKNNSNTSNSTLKNTASNIGTSYVTSTISANNSSSDISNSEEKKKSPSILLGGITAGVSTLFGTMFKNKKNDNKKDKEI